jgi:hypothetical protein
MVLLGLILVSAALPQSAEVKVQQFRLKSPEGRSTTIRMAVRGLAISTPRNANPLAYLPINTE